MLYLAVYVPYFVQVLSAYGTEGIHASAASMEHLSGWKLSVGSYLLLLSFKRFVGCLLQAVLLWLLSHKLRSASTLLAATSILFLLPLLLAWLGVPGMQYFANYMICHPYQSNGFSAEDYRTIFAAASVSEDIGFAFDGREMISQTQAIDEVLSAFMLSTDQSFDDMLNALKTELEQAGIQEVMDECDRQYGT